MNIRNCDHYKTYVEANEAYEALEEYMNAQGIRSGCGYVFGAWLYQPYNQKMMEKVAAGSKKCPTLKE